MALYDYVTLTGLVVPDTSDLQSDVIGEFKGVFGSDLITDPGTPQGALIVAETAARAAVVANNANVANQINPDVAGGVFLDAIWALTGGARRAATYTQVLGVNLGGLPGTFIPAGTQAALTDGLTLFESLADVTLDGSGLGSVDFQAVEPGPLAVPIGALSVPVTAVYGWDTVSNPAAPTGSQIGTLVEGDTPSRVRRKNTLAKQGVSLPEAVTSALYGVPGVKSLAFRENVTGSTATIDGISLVARSIWACVYGGDNAAVAMALLESKSGGCNWNGSTTVSVTEPVSGQAYTVKFDRPTEVAVQVRVTVKRGSYAGDPTAAVRQACLDYAAGLLDDDPGLVVGATASPYEFAGAINRQAPALFVTLVEMGTAGGSWSTSPVTIALNQVATLAEGNIAVIVL